MSFQPKEEKIAERQLIIDYAAVIEAKVIKLQGDDDDGGPDGFLNIEGEEVGIEVRRKVFPNHYGISRGFDKGWETGFLVRGGGIYLNELTIKNYKNKKFLYLVEIKGCKPRICLITASKIDELLSQPYQTETSTNSKRKQSVKTVPLDWFKEYYK